MGIFTGSDKDNDKDLKEFLKQEQTRNDLYDSFDKYHDDLKKSLKSSESSIRDLFQVSNHIASDFCNKSSSVFGEFKSLFNEKDENEDDNDFLRDVKNLDKFLGSVTGGLLSNPFNINYKPLNDKSTGYWAYPSPSSEIYDACKDKNGLAVWDEQGYWRCLFPRAIIPADKLNKVLSKEDVLEDLENKNGLFFQDFNKYLDWKSNMKKILREEKLKKLNELRTQNQSSEVDFDGLKKSQYDESFKTGQLHKDKKITGTKEYNSAYIFDGVKTEIKKTIEYYDDGSSSVREITKNFNKDTDSKPIIKESIQDFPAKKTGWFWDNSDDE